MKHTRKYIRSAFWQLFSRAGVAILTFLAMVVVARGFGVEAFGVLNYIISFVMIFSFLAKAGVGPVMNRELSQNSDRTNDIFSAGILLSLGFSLFAYILMISVGYLIEPEAELRRSFLLMGLIYFLMIPVQYEWVFNSQIRGRPAAVARLGACGIIFSIQNKEIYA